MSRPDNYRYYTATGELVAKVSPRVVSEVLLTGAGRVGADNPGVVVMVDDLAIQASSLSEDLTLYLWKDSYFRPYFA